MKRTLKLSIALAAAFAALAIATAQPALAQTHDPTPTPVAVPTTAPTPVPFEDDRRVLRGDQTISGENFTLRSGETLQGDLTVFGGSVTLEERSRVEGDVSVIGGNTDIAGAVTGDVNVVGSSVRLRSSANVAGDIIRVSGNVTRDTGAVLGGGITTMNLPFTPGDISTPVGETQTRVVVRDRGPFNWFFSTLAGAIAAVVGAVLISIVAIAIVALVPSNVAQATATVSSNWLMSGAVGALTIIAVPIIAVVLAITICLIPFALLLMLAYGIAILAGWTVSARIVGERVVMALNRRDWSVLGQTLAGAVLLALVGAAPLIGPVVGFVAAALGLGALILTRAGTRTYPPSLVPSYNGPSIPPEPAPPPPLAPREPLLPDESR